MFTRRESRDLGFGKPNVNLACAGAGASRLERDRIILGWHHPWASDRERLQNTKVHQALL